MNHPNTDPNTNPYAHPQNISAGTGRILYRAASAKHPAAWMLPGGHSAA